MRTPGDDFELTAGFLFAEGVVAGAGEIRRLSFGRGDGASLTDEAADEAAGGGGAGDEPGDPASNIVIAELAEGVEADLRTLERHFFATSACGVCGKAGLETLTLRGCSPPPPGPVVAGEVLALLPERLRTAQGNFADTGGLHAAALFDADGELVAVREDVGRHNALDKLVGWALLGGRLPLSRGVVLVSGRSSYELLQKSLVAGVPVVCSVSAPSSLAVELARRFGLTLVGFLRDGRFNVYSRPDRIAGVAASSSE
jgi:FdhD protein